LKALEEREAQYRLIVETTAEGVLVLDSEGKTTFANNQMAKMLGYTLNNMFGLSLFTFIHEENQAQAAANIELCRKVSRNNMISNFVAKMARLVGNCLYKFHVRLCESIRRSLGYAY
jgi:PAS domain S-box-containing protein